MIQKARTGALGELRGMGRMAELIAILTGSGCGNIVE